VTEAGGKSPQQSLPQDSPAPIVGAGEGQRLLKVQEVCRLLSISRASLYRLVEKRKIPHVIVGASIRFRSRALDDWISRHTKVPLDQLSGPGRPTGLDSNKMVGRGGTQ
jgi:excisionase family DNA binding protein